MPGTPGGAAALRRQEQSAADRAENQGLGRKRKRDPFDADRRRQEREDTPVTIGGVTFKRRRKVWTVTRLMRTITREQEAAVARATRLQARTAELEAEQIEAAAKGETGREEELERTIVELVAKADESREEGEVLTFRLIALLLVPPDVASDAAEDPLSTAAEALELDGVGPMAFRAAFGPVEDVEDAMPAVEFLQGELDDEDAIDVARELAGEVEPDPQMTPSSETGST
jgi:hypothetical protein